MDFAKFFAHLRRRDSGLFGTSLRQSQVEGTEAIVHECARCGADLGQTAYILATAYGETGAKMQPQMENLSYSAKRLRQVWPRRFPNNATAQKYARNPQALANYVYNGRMGNRVGSNDGWVFRGAGLGQITGRNNFTKWSVKLGLPLVSKPELLMQLNVSVKALVAPMLEGWATGKALPEYVHGSRKDYGAARKVWNGTFEASKYAKYAQAFERALLAGQYEPQKLVDKPKPAAPAPAEPSKPRRPVGPVVGGISATGAIGVYAYTSACDWPWLVQIFNLTCGG